jgi:hypothetical protein
VGAIWWVLPGLVAFGLTVWAGHRALMSADGSNAGMADALGNMIDVFNPAQARADRDLKQHFNAGTVTRSPDDDDDDPIRLIRNPDGSPRVARVRRKPR